MLRKLSQAALAAFFVLPLVGGEISYNRDIRPILSDNCFFCHGPDQNTRKAKLRLDIREDALEKDAFVPGNPDESELIKRVLTEDPDDIMPPVDSHKKLSGAQIEKLRQWVAQGAIYEGHWAYTPPVKPAVPDSNSAIDHLVLTRLKEIGLDPAPEADKRTLLRRLYFDLAGLPPRPQDVQQFLGDSSPEAYSNAVNRLLAMPEYGERMALSWLDVVRFADTIGYHSDNPRNIWPYRDYVIQSYNDNKPFDQFTREQIAGDLLPNASVETRVGSAFNRLLLSTEEGGAQAKDYESRMLTDRVRAVGTVWLGQTIGCAQCHDHKFDPITMRDFYSMGAFFADIKEPIIGRREDGMLVLSPDQQAELERLEHAVNNLQEKLDGPHPSLEPAFDLWKTSQLAALARESLWTALSPAEVKSIGRATLNLSGDHSILVKGAKPDRDTYQLLFNKPLRSVQGLRIEVLPDDSLPAKGPGRAGNGNFVLTQVIAEIRKGDQKRPLAFTKAEASIEQAFAGEKHVDGKWSANSVIVPSVDPAKDRGWAILPEAGKTHHLVLHLAETVNLADGESLFVELRQNHGHGNHTIGKFRVAATQSRSALEMLPQTPVPSAIADLLASPAASNSRADELWKHFKGTSPEFAPLRDQLAAARKARAEYEAGIARCLVSVSETPRTVRILPRGNWMIESGEPVQPALPAYLADQPAPGAKLTRLDLANWLVARDNPLTARVIMNRLWKQFFGSGVSKVLDDLGAQGEPPPNQALLDWLACEFMDSGWDMKHMVRIIVNSATYKQTSIMSQGLRARDPYNRELAAQSRWRLDAELVRDNALSIAGLLVQKIGGPSVKPYQPDGYWENLNFPPRNWEHSQGPDQYRRGLYTWWQRSFLHPSMLAFDAPSREECAAERNRSNIPQQALVLLNDPTYVEASRAFATRILTEGGQDAASRIAWAWQQALSRAPEPAEIQTIEELLQKHLREYQQDAAAAAALLKVGLNPAPANLDPAELAAWTNAARVILNLHETITRS